MEPRIRWSAVLVMVVIWAGLYIVLTYGTGRGHMEDPDSCAVRLQPYVNGESTLEKEGPSEDGRDYVQTWTTGGPTIEVHFILLPQSQSKQDGRPAYLEPPLSYWLDNNGDGFYEELFLDPRHQAACDDMVHLIWDGEKQTYRLVTGGKEHI